jgi:hypothetical protein
VNYRQEITIKEELDLQVGGRARRSGSSSGVKYQETGSGRIVDRWQVFLSVPYSPSPASVFLLGPPFFPPRWARSFSLKHFLSGNV